VAETEAKAKVDDLLRQGITAAKAGQRERARELLMDVVEQDEENVLAWLWLSGVVDSLEDREVCLENVLSLDPANDMARKGLTMLQRQRAQELMRQGTAAAQAGQRGRAYELLTRVVALDEKNVAAWLWLSDVADDVDEQKVCLQNALSLDPYNDAALRGLALLEKQEEKRPRPPGAGQESPMGVRTPTHATPAAAVLREDFASRQPPTQPEPLSPKVDDEFEDAYLCPYCAALTDPNDLKCKACDGDLWVKFRLREERSAWLWSTLTLPISGALQSGVGLVLLLLYAYIAHTVPGDPTEDVFGFVQLFLRSALEIKTEPFELLPVYFGLSGNVPPQVASTALEALPRPIFFLFTLPFLFSLTILIGLFYRWKPILYLYLVSSALGLILAIVGMLLSSGNVYLLASAGFVALTTALMLVMGYKIREDFKWEKERILLRVDPGLSSAADLIVRGNFYAQQKMWAMAAIHLRRAAGLLLFDPDPRLALAAAYLRLKRFDRVAEILAHVERIAPGDLRIGKLRALLDEVRPTENAPGSA
jgi:tetratricopeptide (TPR) repeat protein